MFASAVQIHTSAVGRNIALRCVYMNTELYCQEVLTAYPEYVSKEQMRKICHIRKSTCLFLLENKLVPNMDNGQATHRFKIKTTDVVEYLKQREEHPERFRPTSKSPRTGDLIIFSEEQCIAFRSWCEKKLSKKPDLLTAADVCEFTGYTASTVSHWRNGGHLRYLSINNRFLYPQECLLDFLTFREMVSCKSASTRSHPLLCNRWYAKHKEYRCIHHTYP